MSALKSALDEALADVAGAVVVHAPDARSARLDDALAEDVDGTIRALERARAEGKPFVLVSRLSAVGPAKGLVAEGVKHSFDLDTELSACRAAVAYAKQSASFADHESKLADDTRRELRALGGAASGSAFVQALDRARDRALGEAMERALVERAGGWRYPTQSAWASRGYTAALAELATRDRGVPTAIVRIPAVLEDVLPALSQRAHDSRLPLQFPAGARLEALPADTLAAAIAAVAQGLAKSGAGGVVHVTGPLLGTRLSELLALHKRRVERDRDRDLSERARDLLRTALDDARQLATPSAPPPWASAPPFFSDDVRFSTRQLRVFCARAGVPPISTDLDWRTMLLTEALPQQQAQQEARSRVAEKLPRPAWDSLAHLLLEVAERYRSRPALSRIDGDDVVDVSYTELLSRARAVARRLRDAGVQPGERLVLAGANDPAWGIVAFGAAFARAVLVPLDANLESDAVANIVRKARPTLAVVDVAARKRFGAALPEPVLDLQLTAVDGPGIDELTALPAPGDVASILFTSGTTGDPKGVELTHRNFTALLSSLQSIFPVGEGDRMLSVLPLHHTFEFSCGLLMPLASGTRIYTPDALTGERVLFSLKKGQITALVGVPALWQLLERRIAKQAAERGDVVKSVLEALLAANRALGKRTGKSIGKIALKPIHDELGGHLKTLISGGSALPPSVHEMFQGLGLPLAEGYGLTEAAPVLTVAEGVPGAPSGTVGRPIPGVELRIVDVDPRTGAGEVWARGPNVMRGYFENPDATRATLEDGWLKTGDLGKIDDDGRLRLVGRSKDVVVTAAGENVYLDDMEKKLENIELISQLTLLGLPDPRGGERLALAYVVADGADAGAALKNLQARILKLPQFARPAVVESVPGPLPLTATRKVKRKEVRKTLEGILAGRSADDATVSDAAPMATVRAAIALVAGVDARKLTGTTRPAQDLGFDSLMWTELGASLERIAGGKLDPEGLVACEDVAAVEALVRRGPSLGGAAVPLAQAREAVVEPARPSLADLALPFVKPLGRAALTFVQREAYRTIFDATVTGRANIPHNRNAIVVANHTSHLDTGLVKFALGTYGKDLRPLAAKDYFFEGSRAKVAFFEHFTNLVPIDRETGSGLAFEQARAVVEGGHVTLIFPEGTRREDGTLGGFKPLVARLSLVTGVDVLPIYMKGNYDALPRGSLVPNMNARALEAHIGPPLQAGELQRLTAHLPPVQQARAATDVIRRAIVALMEGKMLELSRVTDLASLEKGVVVRAA